MTKILFMARDVDGNLRPVAVDAQGRLVISTSTEQTFEAGAIFGTEPNYSEFNEEGTLRAFGDATCFRDELQSVTGARLESPASDFVLNVSEGSVTAEATARYPTDYIFSSWQLNHDWIPGTIIFPHIHWWQTTVNMPNWILAYRWQAQGQAKVTDWTDTPWNHNVFTYEAGTLNQITRFPGITPPANYGQVSDIVQIRLYRDVTNVSTLFDGAETSPVDQDLVNTDVHLQVDMLGSDLEYTKYT